MRVLGGLAVVPGLRQYRPRLMKMLPFLHWWWLARRTVLADAWAGLTGAVIVLPQGVAFATIAGLPPEYGLYSAMVPAVVAALFGSSMHLISGPTTAISIVVLANVSGFAEPMTPEYIQFTLTLTLMAGLIQLGLGLARMGAIINFVSHSVVVGFTAGAALLIATSQVGPFFGLAMPRGASFVATWAAFVQQLPGLNPSAAVIASATLAVAALLRWARPRWPGLLIAMVSGSFLCLALGGPTRGVNMVGALPPSLPPPSLPDLSVATLRGLFPGAMAVAMLGLAEAVSIARAVATRTQQRIDNNQEFIGQGLANVVGSFFSSYASSGSFTRTGVNYDAGAKTPMAAIFAAGLLAVILLLVAPYTAYLPIPAMAGVILLVSWKLISFGHIARIFRMSRQEGAVMAATFLATLLVGLEFAIFAGVLLSLLLYLNRTSHPHFISLVPNPEDPRRGFVNATYLRTPECPQLKIARLDGSIFFGAVNHIAEELHHLAAMNPEQCHMLIVGSGINFIDAAGCEMIFQEGHSLYLEGRQVYLCSLKGEVMGILMKGGCLLKIGRDNIFSCKEEAIREIVPRLDPERCRICRARIFWECADKPGAAGE